MVYTNRVEIGVIDNPIKKSLYYINWDDTGSPIPPPSGFIITETGDFIVTETGDRMITE